LRAVTTNLLDLEASLNRTGVFENLTAIHESPWITEEELYEEICEDQEVGIDLLRKHLYELYNEFFRAYRQVVDTNFPTLKNAFALREQMPVRLFVEPKPHIDRARRQIIGELITVCERLPKGLDNEVVICFPGELVPSTGKGVRYRCRQLDGAYQVSFFGLESKMYSMGDLLLTNMVYDRISEEWPDAARYLRREEGLDKP
jgi:hypothetical protein